MNEPSRRRPPRRWLLPLALAAPGVVLVIAGSEIVKVAGATLIAVALIVLVSLVFLEIGLSEDRARERGEE